MRVGGVPAESTQLHMKQFVLFAFYLQFPETEQNNFLYTYKAQKEKTTKLSKKREEGSRPAPRPPTPAGWASEATPWTSSWESGCGLLVGVMQKNYPPEKNPQINPDRQFHGDEEEREEAQEVGVARHTLPMPTGPGRCPRVRIAVLSTAVGGQMSVHSEWHGQSPWRSGSCVLFPILCPSLGLILGGR